MLALLHLRRKGGRAFRYTTPSDVQESLTSVTQSAGKGPRMLPSVDKQMTLHTTAPITGLWQHSAGAGPMVETTKRLFEYAETRLGRPELAKRLKVDEARIGQWLAGTAAMGNSQLLALADLIGALDREKPSRT